MTEWQRLTPEEEAPDGHYIAIYSEIDGEPVLSVGMVVDGQVVQRPNAKKYGLSVSELDALIRISGRWREMPEVKALAEKARAAEVMFDTCAILGITNCLPPQLREDWPHIHTELIAALAAVEAPDDQT